MSDRELLDDAARAAGLELVWSGGMPKEITTHWSGNREKVGEQHVRDWNPLAFDADAFRLAVKLKLQVLTGQGPNGDITWVRAPDEMDIEGPSEHHGIDAYAATRRAIVRAAAEIGRRM